MDTEEADIAQLCAQNIVLWQHFLEAFSGREAVHQHLARIHHQLRVRYIAARFYDRSFDRSFDRRFHRVRCSGQTLRGRFLRSGKSTNVGGGLLRRELSILSGCERDRTKIALSRLATSVAGALPGIGWRSSFVALDLRGSIRRHAAETQKQ